MYSLPLHRRASPSVNIRCQGGTFVTICEPTLTPPYHTKLIVGLRDGHSLGLDQPIRTRIHYDNIIEKFHCRKNPPCSVCSSLLPRPLATFDHTVSIVLPFPKSHQIGLTQDGAFSNWLLSLSNMHLCFLTLNGLILIVPFFLALNNILLYGYTTVYPLTEGHLGCFQVLVK